MKSSYPRRRSRTTSTRLCLEALESRLTPSTFSVDNLNDSGDGSLRQAITNANNNTGADVINFSVAGVIQLTTAALPDISGPVIINGSTAPGFNGAPRVEVNANGFSGLNFILGSAQSTLLSLSIVGSAGAGVVLRDSNMTVQGNYIGLALDGSVDANALDGLLIASSVGSTIGGVAPNNPNVISGNRGNGITITSGQVISSQNLIIGNFIGTDPTGQVARGNLGNGIQVTNGTQNTIGGSAAGQRNVISGNGSGGIQIGVNGSQQAQNTQVLGNLIGTNSTGLAALANHGNGITIFSSNNTIGGFGAGTGNTVASNTQSGVLVNAGSGNAILGNAIFNNTFNGISLQVSGNANAQAPQLGYAIVTTGSGSSQVTVGGLLNAQPNGTFNVQIFASLGNVTPGQGQIFVGNVVVTTNNSGSVIFTLSGWTIPSGAGTTFTATATNQANNNTSEFSNAVSASTPNQVFVANAYMLLLGRGPDSGAAIWVAELDGRASPASVLLGIQATREYLNDQLILIYNRYLQRNPDTGGLQFYLSFLQGGGTFEAVIEQLVSSPEYFNLQGGTNQGFITGLYNNVLNRMPTNAEVNAWLQILNMGVTRPQVAADFVQSPEYYTNLVKADYMTFLLRPVDPAGQFVWVNALASGTTDQQVLASIFGSAEGFAIWS